LRYIFLLVPQHDGSAFSMNSLNKSSASLMNQKQKKFTLESINQTLRKENEASKNNTHCAMVSLVTLPQLPQTAPSRFIPYPPPVCHCDARRPGEAHAQIHLMYLLQCSHHDSHPPPQ
jgi:hypothetical protein